MIAFPWPYRTLAVALLSAALWAHGWMKGAQHGEARLEAFRLSVQLEGAKAQALADAAAKRNQDRKEASDASYQTALRAVSADVDRMRQQARADTYVLPATGTFARSADLACFDRGALDAAIRAFAEGAAGLVGESEAVRLRLTTAAEWARTR